MAITQNMTNSNPLGLNYYATKLDTNNITIPTADIVPDFCFCDFECEYRECVFALVGGTDRQNDKSSFLYKLQISTDSATIKLFKNDVEVATITDNTYGTFYGTGSVPNATGEQLLYVGLILDWESVMSLHGAGTYQIKTTLNIAGTDFQVNSQKFLLLPYTDENANGTFRVKATQNGNLLSSEFDFTGLNWLYQTRIKGKFGRQEPEIEIDNYLDSKRDLQQIQDSIFSIYTMETNLLTRQVYDLLIFNNLLANNIEITDYNVFNPLVYKNLEVYPEEISESNYYQLSQKGKFIIKFTDKRRNILKRNVK